MKFYLLSDNSDTLVGMRLVGIEGEVIHDETLLLRRLADLFDDSTIGVIILTTKLVELIPEVVSELKLKEAHTLIVEIPDRHGTSSIGERLDTYVSRAIGIRLEGKDDEISKQK